jgi:hypothetical protein
MNAKVTDKTAEGKQQTAPIERDPTTRPKASQTKTPAQTLKHGTQCMNAKGGLVLEPQSTNKNKTRTAKQ